MSWNYTVHQINRSFEQIAQCQDFLRRSEAAFRALHERVLFLEQQQASKGPSDEQVERVLRKILAERFSGIQRVENPGLSKDVEYFVKSPDNGVSIPRAPPIDPAILTVDPEAVPSKAYGQTFHMLAKELEQYPQIEITEATLQYTDSKDEGILKRPELPHNHGRPW